MIKFPLVHLGPACQPNGKARYPHRQGGSKPTDRRRQQTAESKLSPHYPSFIAGRKTKRKKTTNTAKQLDCFVGGPAAVEHSPHPHRQNPGFCRKALHYFAFLQANGIQSMQQLHEKIADMNSRYYDLRGKIVKAERRIAILTERGEMWEQYNQYKPIHKQLAKVKPEKREQFEQRHSRELILYDAAAWYLKELKDNGEAITPKAWQLEIDQLAAGKQTDTLAMKSMREDLKAVERLRKTAEQLSRQERDKSHDRGPER